MPSLPFDESTTFTPPPAFGPYRVLHQIGSGVLGPVFRTYDPQSDRLVAVKAFRLDLLPEDVARLADGLRRLVGTAGQLAAGLEGTTAYLAMDYHAAETFDVALRHLAPAPIEAALPILGAMADAIDAAWAAGPAFGHGALHPRDVFVTPGTDELNITGFGVAPALEAIGARAPVRRPYTAPERAAGEAWDLRADVYSLGAIAHELLTGRRPAGPGEQDGTLPASMAPELRVRIRRVLSKALAESPALRFGSARAFVDALADPSSAVESDTAVPVAEDQAAAPVVEAVPPAVPAEPVAVPPTPASAVPRVRRPRVAAPALKVPARVAVPEPVPVPDVATSIVEAPPGIGDMPSRRDDTLRTSGETPDRVMMPQSPLALPSAVPWVLIASVLCAGLVLGAVGMYTFIEYRLQQSPLSPVPSVAVPPAENRKPGVPAPVAPAAGDTEVAVPAPPPAPARPSPAPGRVLVRSTPAGAAVLIDGRSAGRTPLTARDLALAAHTVAVSRPGFVTESRRVTLTSRAPSATLTITLKAERVARPPAAAKGAATGSLSVDSRPRGAQVTIDGRVLGVTPLSAPGLSPGVHAVRVELAGHKPVTTTVTVKAGETAKIAVTLEQR